MALDGLRGVAALLVVSHHTLLMLPDFANVEWRVPGAVPHGAIEWLLQRTPLRLLWAGQERALLFFVLSGFVLGIPWIDGKNEAYGKFLLNRFCRIYPPYILAMVLCAAGAILFGGHRLPSASIYFNSLGWAFPASWMAIPSIVGIVNTPASAYMNEAIWSLVWEVRVAVIFPLLMLAIVRWRTGGVFLCLASLFVLRHLTGWAIGPALSADLNRPQDTFQFAEYFVFGAAVALNRGTIAAFFARHGDRWGETVLLAGILVCWFPFHKAHDTVVAVGAAIVIAAVVGSTGLRIWFSARWLLWLGRLSYSLYLTHLIVVMGLIIAFGGQVPLWGCVLVLPLSIALAAGFRRWVEIPSIQWTQSRVGRRAHSGRLERRINAA